MSKTNPWGRPITEATPNPVTETVPNPWLTRLGKSPKPVESTGNPWIDRLRSKTPKSDTDSTTTSRFGSETIPTGRPRNPWGREKVEPTKPITEQKPAPAATTQTKIVQETRDPLAPWPLGALHHVKPGSKIGVVRRGAGGKWEPAYGFRSG